MKKIGLLFFFGFWGIFAGFSKPVNLYEQLCEVNQEWRKNRQIAQELGFLTAPLITNEQDLLVFHIQTLEKIFLGRSLPNLSETQQQARQRNLQVLNQYGHLHDCPRNYYIPHRIPVFIDEDGRYCAVAYLMLHSGKQEFCEAVQKTTNNIYIRQIDHPTFNEWQQNSGLSLDELAWIQPGYSPAVRMVKWNPKTLHQEPVFLDSLATAKIYLPEYDYKDIFNFNRIFMGGWLLEPELKKIAKPLTQQPNWQKMPTGRVLCAKVFQNELYVSIDSTNYSQVSETELKNEQFSGLFKWSKAQQWEKVLDLSQSARDTTETIRLISSLFEYSGKLYAGGGYVHYTPRTGATDRSYLAILEKGQWQEIKQEFGGYVFGLVYKNRQVYLGIAYNALNLLIEPSPEEPAEPEGEAQNDGK
jgi:hypothetical protein